MAVQRGTHPSADVLNLPPELTANQQYEILRELGRGGMGIVYLAKNKLMDRLEVLKVVNKKLLNYPGAVERFLREIRAAAKLSHTNVVGAYSAVQQGELLAFAMEYVEGQDLASLVKSQGPLPILHACFYVQQAALGLQHAFEKGMVHRDIKPQNLILAREGKKHIVKVLDFGLAKVMREKSEDTGLTGEGKMLGTPDYIAPEQTLDAAKADIRADIYSLGCTLYYLLSGRPPFSATSLGAMLLAHQMQEAKALNLVRPELPEELAAVVRKMMAKSPAQRYQTPVEVVQALSPFVKQGATPKASPELSAGAVEAKRAVKMATPGDPPPAPVTETPKQQPEPAVVWESLTENSAASIIPRKSAIVDKPRATTVRERRSQKKWLIGGVLGVGVLLLTLTGMWASGVFQMQDANKASGETAEIDAGQRRPVRVSSPPAPAPPEIKLPVELAGVGRWEVQGSELVQTDENAGRALLYFGDPSWTDYDFDVSAQPIAGSELYAICFRTQDTLSYWGFGVGVGGAWDFRVIGLMSNFEWGEKEKDTSWAPDNAWHQIRIRVRGNHIECAMDGKKVFDFNDDRYPRGGVGLGSAKSAVRFRDLKVRDSRGKLLCAGVHQLHMPEKGKFTTDTRMPHLVAIYAHQAGRDDPFPLKFYSNGHITAPDWPNTWHIKGNTLILCSYLDEAPGHVWVDTCTLSGDGGTYQGWNNDRIRVKITGQKLSGGDLRNPSASR